MLLSKRVFLFRNAASSEGKIHKFDHSDFDRLKQDAAKTVGVKTCKRIFHSIGVEIKSTDDIVNDDNLYISQGEDFYKNKTNITNKYSISILGAGDVGKSAIVLRYNKNIVVDYWDPTIEDAYTKTIELDGKSCKLEILDTAGQEDYKHLRDQWMEGKDGYVLVYSIEEPESLEYLKTFLDLYHQLGNNNPVIVVGNKIDLRDEKKHLPPINQELLKEILTSFGAIHIEASAIRDDNVSTIFETMVRNINKIRAPPKSKSCPYCLVF